MDQVDDGDTAFDATVVVYSTAGAQAQDIPDITQPQGNSFFIRDTNELQTIDEQFNNKLCKEVPGQYSVPLF